ncbi:hypothetical protein [uncultured Tateyamaria sp.]|uniref:hypothetical protein n=1 Tax=uncultured Tateyamaria sp. TaxID=455651 RepID=UPI0026260A0F|nr:hypothetical protein [uncultured Tateyamaria sp.]
MKAMLATLALVGVAACQTGVSDGQAVPAVATDTVPVAFAAGPGSRAVTPKIASDVIRAACLATRPSFRRAPEALAAIGGFVQNAQTLTYYHQDYDLSVKLIDGRCSTVTGGLKSAQQVTSVPRLAGSEELVSIGRPTNVEGRLYVRFAVAGG